MTSSTAPGDAAGCELRDWDGAYVLGALSAADRTRFEQHLADCPDCRASVQDMAGLPGLLARVPRAAVENPPTVPDTLWPRLVRAAARSRRRSRWTVALAGAAAAAVVVAFVALGWTIWRHTDSGSSAQGPTATTRQFSALPGIDDLTASATIEPVGWGTRIVMHCTGGGYRAQVPYELVVVDKDGQVRGTVGWQGQPNKTTRIELDTYLAAADISRIEVRARDGTPLLRITV